MADEPDTRYEYRKQRYESYTKERDALREDARQSGERYDKAVLSLAGGALALSVTFLEKIAPHPFVWSYGLLGIAWLCLIVAILLELYALAKTQTVTNMQMDLAGADYLAYLRSLPEAQSAGATPSEPVKPQKEIDEHKKSTRSLNTGSLRSLTAGIALICLFSLVNLFSRNTKDHHMAKSEQTRVQPINESKGTYISPSNVLPPPPPPAAATTAVPAAKPADATPAAPPVSTDSKTP